MTDNTFHGPTTGHRIVVGVDGSPPSRQALRWAVRQAALTGATVDAVYAWHIPTTDGWSPMFDLTEDFAKAGDRLLADAIGELAAPSVPVRPHVVQGNSATVLLDAAQGADLLVVGSRGHGGFVGALLGSVSQHCAQYATCPVVVVRGDGAPSAGPTAAPDRSTSLYTGPSAL